MCWRKVLRHFHRVIVYLNFIRIWETLFNHLLREWKFTYTLYLSNTLILYIISITEEVLSYPKLLPWQRSDDRDYHHVSNFTLFFLGNILLGFQRREKKNSDTEQTQGREGDSTDEERRRGAWIWKSRGGLRILRSESELTGVHCGDYYGCECLNGWGLTGWDRGMKSETESWGRETKSESWEPEIEGSLTCELPFFYF